MSVQTIRIVADENILGLEQYFINSDKLKFQINKLPGRILRNADVKNVDILLVRSVTQVNEVLLSHSNVRFVGTATSGMEHIDEVYLQEKGIVFAHAKGANANAVAEYIIACIANLSLRHAENYFEKNIAIVGHGFVGKALEKKLSAFSSTINIYDPLINLALSKNIEKKFYCEWEDVMASDLISVHVPFTQTGKFPTKNLLNKDFFERIGGNSIFLNAARGEICDESALLKKLTESNIKTVLDVWNNEPDISEELLKKVSIASPHIAGYSLNAKFNATKMLAKNVYQYLQIEMPDYDREFDKKISLNCEKTVKSYEDICKLILLAYDPFTDTKNLRNREKCSLKEHFDTLRKNYTHRLEWNHYDLSSIKIDKYAESILRNLGFIIEA